MAMIAHARIADRCPSCGNTTLVVGSGGWLVCSWLKCKNPSAAHEVLSSALAWIARPGEEHVPLADRVEAIAEALYTAGIRSGDKDGRPRLIAQGVYMNLRRVQHMDLYRTTPASMEALAGIARQSEQSANEEVTRPSGAEEPEQGAGSRPLTRIDVLSEQKQKDAAIARSMKANPWGAAHDGVTPEHLAEMIARAIEQQ